MILRPILYDLDLLILKWIKGPTKIGLQAVQGFVSLTDATPQTGGLCVIPGSHTSHDDLMSYAPRWDDDFVIVPEPEINPACRGGKLVQCKAGDLVLWDSRTVSATRCCVVQVTDR